VMVQCWFNSVGAGLVQCWCSVGAVLVQCWCSVGAVLVQCWFNSAGAVLVQCARVARGACVERCTKELCTLCECGTVWTDLDILNFDPLVFI
jgi:hypothetical protein